MTIAKVVQAKKQQKCWGSSPRKSSNKNLNFLFDLVMVASDTKPTEDETQTFNKACARIS